MPKVDYVRNLTPHLVGIRDGQQIRLWGFYSVELDDGFAMIVPHSGPEEDQDPFLDDEEVRQDLIEYVEKEREREISCGWID